MSPTMNLFKIIAHQTCGADPTTLLTLYRTLICSKLDYGAIVYNSARKVYLKILEPAANQAVRICLGDIILHQLVVSKY